ncbi:MAG TPA: M50 family metallopeptidase [Pyrinomonadaceae bacterium]
MSSALNYQAGPANIGEISLSLPKGCELWEIDTSFVETQWLLLTPGNKKFHVSAKASDVLSEIVEEQKSLAEIASNLSERWKTEVSPQDVLSIIDSAQWPRNLIRKLAPWEEAQVLEETSEERRDSRKSSVSEFFFRIDVVPARAVYWLVTHLRGLYGGSVFAAAAVVIALVQVAVFRQVSSASSWAEFLHVTPAGYVAVFGLVTLSVIFHELGHATATARYGVKPGAIGFGIYFIYPALYTELGFAWLLPRARRAVIDVGGFYFQLLASVPLYAAFALTGDKSYVLAIIVNDFLILFSLFPFFKFDGYWLLSDLLGVPNLQKRAAEVLRSPLAVIRSPFFKTQGGLSLPRKVALALMVYGALFKLFRVFFAYMILRNGPSLLWHAPSRMAAMAESIVAFVARGEYAAAVQQGIWAFGLVVTVVALVLIFRAYARWLWGFVKKLRPFDGASGRGSEVLNERSINP